MKVLLPKEHGAWAMLIVPFFISVMVHKQNWLHIPLFFGWLFFYLSSYPLLMVIRSKTNIGYYKKWIFIYVGVAAVFLSIPLVFYPGLLLMGVIMLPLLLVNIYFTSVKKDRHLLNDFSAITGLSLGAVAVGYISAGVWTGKSLVIWLFAVLFFMGSVFYVKSMIREKNNPVFNLVSWSYHVSLIILSFVISCSWMLTFAYMPSLVRVVLSRGRTLTPLQIGKMEILNSLFFSFFLIIYLK